MVGEIVCECFEGNTSKRKERADIGHRWYERRLS